MRGIGLLLCLGLVACAVPTPPEAAAPQPTEAAASVPPGARVAAGTPARPERFAVTTPARPAQPLLAATFRVELVADPCTDRDLAAPSAPAMALTLLDRSYALPASYEPDDLVPAAAAGFEAASGDKLVRAVVVEDLADLRTAATAEGLAIVIDSAYRSYAAQAATFEAWALQLGAAAASLRAARPGHSEHQLGTALDVSSPGWSGRFGDWARETAEGRWMADHAWEYGFVMSYPVGADAETCFGYEPWHYRWIGRERAAEHRADGRPLRSFLADRVGG